METIYHNKATECPPGKHEIIPLVDNEGNVGIVCQRCGKRTYEQKYVPTSDYSRPLSINESGVLV
jgi:hypothetical protein